jgi:SpoVK/Ycf46/Vps4 family AAA+-type ATPase
MFLRELDGATSALVQRQLLGEYDASPRSTPDAYDWVRLIDVPVEIQGNATSIKRELEEQIIEPVVNEKNVLAGIKRIEGSKAVLLFGPPGTAKTKIVRTLARRIGWPFLEITPSDFLRDDLSGIYSRSTEIFEDLMDLSGCVVLLDEMDSLVQSRGKEDGDRLDVTRELLTTSMLPKLAALHERARVLLFMNTNYQSTLDDAIKRPGRFDLLLFVGPPPWEAKLASLELWWKQLPEAERSPVRTLLSNYAPAGSPVADMLDRFTLDETSSFLRALAGKQNQRASLETLSAQGFKGRVKEWSETYITLRKGGDWHKALEEDTQASRRQQTA